MIVYMLTVGDGTYDTRTTGISQILQPWQVEFMIKLSNAEVAVLLHLRITVILKDNSEWNKCNYARALNNLEIMYAMSPKSFATHLSNLARKGYYQKIAGRTGFGLVKMTGEMSHV